MKIVNIIIHSETLFSRRKTLRNRKSLVDSHERRKSRRHSTGTSPLSMSLNARLSPRLNHSLGISSLNNTLNSSLPDDDDESSSSQSSQGHLGEVQLNGSYKENKGETPFFVLFYVDFPRSMLTIDKISHFVFISVFMIIFYSIDISRVLCLYVCLSCYHIFITVSYTLHIFYFIFHSVTYVYYIWVLNCTCCLYVQYLF